MNVLHHTIPIFVLPLVWLVTASCSVDGAEFRIETAIYDGTENEPASRLLTLFAGNQIYDLPMDGSGNVVILDSKQNRFTLLDHTRGEQTVVAVKRLREHEQEIGRRAREDDLPSWFRELAQPEFKLLAGEIEPFMKLTGSAVTYEVRGTKFRDNESMQLYFLFADATARLNYFILDWPPQARLKLNEALQTRHLMPVSVLVSIESRRPLRSPGRDVGVSLQRRFEHQVTWHLTDKDRKQIARVNRDLSRLDAVPFNQYLKATQQGPGSRKLKQNRKEKSSS